MTTQVTHNIEISARPKFIPEESDFTKPVYFFSYTITIRNRGSQNFQLLSRHWVITDAFGRREEVKGPGVVGVQPTISPGNEFEYSSFCPLTTPSGTMSGTYQMKGDDGSLIDATIPEFHLVSQFH